MLSNQMQMWIFQIIAHYSQVHLKGRREKQLENVYGKNENVTFHKSPFQMDFSLRVKIQVFSWRINVIRRVGFITYALSVPSTPLKHCLLRESSHCSVLRKFSWFLNCTNVQVQRWGQALITTLIFKTSQHYNVQDMICSTRCEIESTRFQAEYEVEKRSAGRSSHVNVNNTI